MRRVHLIYPHEPRISSPDAIGSHLAAQLRPHYDVRLYDWTSTAVIRPRLGDVLLGHPHPSPWTIFRRSSRRDGWSRRLILAPYNHGDLRQSAWLNRVVASSDLYLAITGEHWFRSAPASAFAHWTPKMVQMDLAVDRRDFPPIKRRFNPPGRRRFLFIGHSRWTKNVGYLSNIARKLGDGSISWMGVGRPIQGTTYLGSRDFRDKAALELVSQHDFVLSVGRADASPAAVLEAMAWGLIPVCSKESSHAELEGIVHVPLGDADGATYVLTLLQDVDETTLHTMQEKNWDELDTRFTWSRFGERVINAIESSESPHLLSPKLADRMKIELARLISPYAWWHPTQIVEQIRRSRRG